MKYTLLLTAIILTHAAAAQKIEAGLNAGINYNTNDYLKKKIGYSAMGKIIINVGKIQFGAGIEAYSILGKQTKNVPDYKTGKFVESEHVTYIAAPYTAFNLYFNGRSNMVNSYFYYGVTAGGVLAQAGSKGLAANPNTFELQEYKSKNSISGYNVGAQIGIVTYPFKRIGFSGEAAVRYAGFSNATSTLFFPLTVGVRYRL